MTDPLDWLAEELRDLETRQLRRQLATRSGPQTPRTVRLNQRRLINFGANDYLGLAAAPQLSEAVHACLAQRGWGSGASPLLSGRSDLHAELEQQLAEFEGVESALLFPSGFAANVGAITSLVRSGDAVFSDAKNHASIIDGCRLSGARTHVYAHADTESLERLLAGETSARRRLIVTDGLFSMDGDLAPLPRIAELAEQYGSMLMVDEAHATGVLGASGRGTCEHLGVERKVHVRVGTLSKALGSVGGFVVGRRDLIAWLVNRARPYFFSTAPPAAVAAAGLAALRLVRAQPERRRRLLERAASLRSELTARGWCVGRSHSQIIPLLVGQPERALQLSERLQQEGVYAPGIRPPSVPVGESLLRITLSYAHSDQDRQRLLEVLGENPWLGDRSADPLSATDPATRS